MYKEWSGKSMAEVELLSKKAIVLEFARTQLSQQKVEGAEHQAQYAELQERLVKIKQKVQEGELLRCKLHNTIMELKGNI